MIEGFHKEGQLFLVLSTAIALISTWGLSTVHTGFFFWLLVAFWAVMLYLFFQFFRVPARRALTDDALLMSPCDGKVVVIEEVFEPEHLKCQCRQISIFMSPLNVHINWYPAAGEVSYVKYHPGKFLVAWHPKSSTENERSTVAIRGKHGEYLMRQIAGAVARRIRTYAKPQDAAEQGKEMGFIKFGSRVDLYIPLDAEVLVSIDDKVQGLLSPIARW